MILQYIVASLKTIAMASLSSTNSLALLIFLLLGLILVTNFVGEVECRQLRPSVEERSKTMTKKNNFEGMKQLPVPLPFPIPPLPNLPPLPVPITPLPDLPPLPVPTPPLPDLPPVIPNTPPTGVPKIPVPPLPKIPLPPLSFPPIPFLSPPPA